MAERTDREREGDIILPPNTYALVLDETKGRINVYVGPFKSSLSTSDQLVRWNDASGRFEEVRDVRSAITPFIKANEGQYITLSDPARDEDKSHPATGNIAEPTDLDAGHRIVIPGPATFPLWPGQTAKVLDGHHLRHNQWVLVRVYDPAQAEKHTESAVIAPSGGSEEETLPESNGFTMGQLFAIKGTNTSYFIPWTGVEVVPEPPNGSMPGSYVRSAVTLERLEYCILLSEDGNKRYVQGPDVVFPEPTEQFVTNADGERKSKAFELNPQSGLYLKVIAPYADDDGDHPIGEELFITGEKNAIYFPRQEHLIITYGEQRKHHAIAIPSGEARYVLNRDKGNVDLVRGPNMFLPDPRHQVIIRRVLDPATVMLMYPNNNEALEVNARFTAEQAEVENVIASAQMASPQSMMYSTANVATSFAAVASSSPEELMRSARTAPGHAHEHGGPLRESTKLGRGTKFTPPRTIVLNTKYEGAVTANIWPGYAVLVTNKTGARRVETGPVNLLLEYDESLMPLSLSTGRPKNDSRLFKTAYLRTINNQVSDRIELETQDLVPVQIDLSFRVNFEGEPGEGEDPRLKWFDVENYVQLLVDNCRSRLRNLAKRHKIQEFYTNTIDLIRDQLLGVAPEGGDRPGLSFTENGMRLFDVEVLGVEIQHPQVEQLLSKAMNTALEGTIRLSEAEDANLRESRFELLKQESISFREQTREVEAHAAIEELGRSLSRRLEEISNELRVATERQDVAELERAEMRTDNELEIDLDRQRGLMELDREKIQVELFVQRMGVLSGSVSEALALFGDKAFVEKMMEAVGPVAATMGITTADMFTRIFEGSPYEHIMESLSERPFALQAGNSQSE